MNLAKPASALSRRTTFIRGWSTLHDHTQLKSRQKAVNRICQPKRQARWTCSSSRRRRNIGVPKNVQVDPPARPLTAEESPWEDYLIPELEGNSRPTDTTKFSRKTDTKFIVLGVESSCDDTAAAVVRSDGVILGEASISQNDLTEAWGGVVPHVARDAHESAIHSVINSALRSAGLTAGGLDAVAATMGPGLEVCLRVGYRAAREVARAHQLEFVAVNHLEAHLMVARMPANSPDNALAENHLPFPFLTLLVSGGHCQLLLARDVADYEVIGGTLDDALGEAYDKTARLLGLRVGGGGGPALEALARDGDVHAIPFPVPMAKRPDCNFSFAGLKTSVRVAIDKLGGDEQVKGDRQVMANVAASFQETAVRHLEQRVRRALRICSSRLGSEVDTLVVSGGVAANMVIRTRLRQLCEEEGWKFVVPPVRLCTDNGVMVAWTGVERLYNGIADDTNHLDVRARWPLAGLGELSTPLPKDVSAS